VDIILLHKVPNLGVMGDRVKVRAGYARNFLLPKGKATLATEANVKKFEARRAEFEREANEQLGAAQARAEKAKGLALRITSKAGTEGKLFGSIGTADIVEAATAAGLKVERSEVRMPGGPIRAVGEHTIVFHLHSDVELELPLTVVAEE
jgi:large subunit ribosomal protein L9